MAYASLRKHRAIWRDTVSFIDAMLRHPDHEATTDDAVAHFGLMFADGGKWRGSIVRELAQQRLIADTGRSVKSCREHRHGARIVVWRAVDLQRLDDQRRFYQALLDAHPEPPDPGTQATLWPTDRGPAPNEKSDAAVTASPKIESPSLNGEFKDES